MKAPFTRTRLALALALALAAVLVFGGLGGAWLTDARLDAADDARADAARAARAAEADAADARAAHDAYRAHVNATLGDELALYARGLTQVEGDIYTSRDVLRLMWDAEERLRLTRDVMGVPNAPEPPAVAALNTSAHALDVGYRAFEIGVLPNASLHRVTSLGHALLPVVHALGDAPPPRALVTALRLNASALVVDAEEAFRESVDLVSVRLDNESRPRTLTLAFAGRIPADSWWWGVTVCGGERLFDGPCVAVQDVERMGFPEVPFEREANDTLVMEVPERVVNASTVFVQAFIWSPGAALRDACLLTPADAECVDARGDVAREA